MKACHFSTSPIGCTRSRNWPDTCSVFRNGRHIETFSKGAHTDEEIVQLLIGRDLTHVYPPKPVRTDKPEPVLEVRNLNWQPSIRNVNFTIGRGEIVGLGGLDGQGQRELLLALFGVLRGVSGDILVNGEKVRIGSPAAAKSDRLKIALIPEDRKTEGLMLPMGIDENISMAALPMLTKGLVIDRSKEAEKIAEAVERIQIKVGQLSDPVATLSGGNQQKVVIAKWLLTGARIILLNDPTRGIDVGTKQEIYQLLRNLADDDTSILFYTTDYDELIGSCDRVLILYDGAVVRELEGDEITETNIVSSSLNLPVEQAAGTVQA